VERCSIGVMSTTCILLHAVVCWVTTIDKVVIMGHVYDFYRQLIGTTCEERAFMIGPSLWPTTKLISGEDNADLERNFNLEELDEVLQGMKIDSASGPDGPRWPSM
jgi:hypothetical protein